MATNIANDTASLRIIVAGDGYADELEDTGEFLPLDAARLASLEADAASATAAIDASSAPVPEAPAATATSATPNERAAFWLKHLESEIERLQRRWELIAAELSSREDRIEQLLGEARSQQSTVDGLREDIAGRVIATTALQADLDATNVRIKELAAAQAERDAALAQRGGELDETRAQLAARQAELVAAAAAHQELLAALERSRTETAAAAKRHASELTAGDVLRVKIQELEAYIDGRSSSWSAQNAKIAEYRTDLAAVRTSVAATDSRLMTQTAENQRLVAKLADVEREASTLAARCHDSENKNTDLERRLTEEAATTDAVRGELVAARRSREDVSAELTQREELITSLERGVLRRDETIAELERTLQRSHALETQLGTANGSLMERLAEHEQTIAQRDEQIRTLQETAANAERSAHDSDQRSGTLERLLRDSTDELADLQERLGVRDGIIGGLKLDLRAKQDALDMLEQNVHRLNDLGTRLEGIDGAVIDGTMPSTQIMSANVKPLLSRAARNPVGDLVDNAEPVDPDALAATTGRMIIAVDGSEARRYRLRPDGMTIGRSVKSDIRIASPFISRFHARILMRDEQALIEDLGSKNGILINSKPVGRTASLHDGDVINLGGSLELKYVDLDRRNGAAAPP